MAVRKALIVDDSKVARFTLAKRLQGHGLTVLSAESADDAINQLRTEKPDVIFMDFMMPGVNGLQAAEHLAADASTANIPVIMCTGNDASELNMDNASGNVCGILTKGSDDQELLAMLDSLPAAPAAPAPAPIDLDALVEQATQRALEAANRHAEEMVGRHWPRCAVIGSESSKRGCNPNGPIPRTTAPIGRRTGWLRRFHGSMPPAPDCARNSINGSAR